jgi:MFS family permease/quinol monooxygenase YgiN
MAHNSKGTISTWSPLNKPFFRTLWIANVVSLVGAWMHEVGVAWLMTSLTPSPFMVALVQTATMLPFFLLALPAGALADILDRRRILLVAQGWMLFAALGLAVLTLLNLTTPVTLLIFTFALSLGAAMNNPAWQAIIPELVTRDEMPSAVTLGSVGFNIARVLGPALGGLVVAMVGPGGTFMLNALSFTGVMAVLKHWHRETHESALPAERLMGAMRVGIRYVRNAQKIQIAFIHMGVFSLFSSALWAFLPVVARTYLGLSAMGYGALLGSFGVGGLAGATLLPKLKSRLSLNALVAGTVICFTLLFMTLAFARSFIVLAPMMCAGGIGWMVLVSVLNTAVQGVTPAWVRGRVLSVFMLVFFGGLSGGSLMWGSAAIWFGIPKTLVIAAACLVAGGAATWRLRLSGGEGLDLTPSYRKAAATLVAEGLQMEEKPVLVIVEYEVVPDRMEEFMEAVRALKRIRLRDGAIRWNLFRDVTNPDVYVESFIVESWVEHLRQHERLTVSDREILDRTRAFHSSDQPVIVRHFILEPVR